MAKLGNFFREVNTEMGRVTWPTRQETIRYTGVVVVMSLLVAAFLGGLDIFFGWLLNLFIF